jgi:predicted MFS family arabinose efflux permease
VRAPGAERVAESGRPERAAGLLALVPVVAALDRGVLAALVEGMRADLWLTDLQLGLVATVFALAAAVAPLAASRRGVPARGRLLAAGLASSSLALLVAATAPRALVLLAACAAAGAGASLFPARDAERGASSRRLGLATSVPIAVAVGLALSAAIGARFGWRAALATAALPGIAAAALSLRRARAAGDRLPAASGAGELAEASHLLRSRPLALSLAGLVACAFGASALAFWTPAFLERVRGVPRGLAGLEFAVIVLMTGLAGPTLAGAVTAALRPRVRRPEAWTSAGATLAAAALALAMLFAARPPLYLVALVGVLLLVSAAFGPAVAEVLAAAPPPARGAALALAVVAARLAGDAPAAAIVGLVSHVTSLWWGMLAVPAALLAGGVALGLAAWRAERAARRPHPGIIR